MSASPLSGKFECRSAIKQVARHHTGGTKAQYSVFSHCSRREMYSTQKCRQVEWTDEQVHRLIYRVCYRSVTHPSDADDTFLMYLYNVPLVLL